MMWQIAQWCVKLVLSGDSDSCKSDKTKSGVCETVGDNDVANSPNVCEPCFETVCNDDVVDNSIVCKPCSDIGDDNVNVHSEDVLLIMKCCRLQLMN